MTMILCGVAGFISKTQGRKDTGESARIRLYIAKHVAFICLKTAISSLSIFRVGGGIGCQ
jgi:hypothetical protein